MANPDRPSGAVPKFHLQGIDLHSIPLRWHLRPATDSTVIGLYDPVKSVDICTDATYPDVTRATAGVKILGVAMAFRADTPSGTVTLAGSNEIGRLEYAAASTKVYVGVLEDPYVVFEMQEDSDTLNIAAANIGSCVDMVASAPNSTTYLSTVELNSSDAVVTDSTTVPGGAQFRILGLSPRLDIENAVGTNAKWLVQIVEHELTSTTGI